MDHSICVRDLDLESYQKLSRAYAKGDGAEDAFHEVLLRLLKKPSSVHGAYFGSAIRNAGHDLWRKNSTRRRYESEFAESASLVDTRSPLDNLEAERLRASLDNAIKAMPVVDQSIFEQRYAAGYPIRQIASELGLHTSSVEKRIAKIKKHLFEQLSDTFE
ncbi:MAG: sigma-70 family RNA polymerase sigma factor [Pseudomonadota bacterium]